jgi:REP element-mobilizing transposase RayT
MSGYDYSQPNHYFVTICVKDFKPVFGKVKDSEMVLNEIGRIVQNQWLWLQEQYNYIILHEFVCMPEHFHGIIEIANIDQEGNGRDRSLLKIKSLSELIGAFKTTSSKKIHQSGLINFKWQKSFYDRIIETDEELENIRWYIKSNPEHYNVKDY